MKAPPPAPVLPEASDSFLASLNRNQQSAYRLALSTFQQFAEINNVVEPGVPLPSRRLGRSIVSDFYVLLQVQLKESEISSLLLAVEHYLRWLRQHRGFQRRVWPPAVLPKYAERFLAESVNHQQQKSYDSYRSALLNFQRFAEETNLTNNYIPLPSSVLTETVLADYYSWLISEKKSDATIRLYLIVASLYLEWLDAEKKLTAKVHFLTVRAKLRAKTKLRRVKPAKRGSDKLLGLLIAHFDRKVSKPEARTSTTNPKQDEWFTQQSRLIALRNRALIHTLYSTAGRAAEVAALTCSIVKLEVADDERIKAIEAGGQPEQAALLRDTGLAVSVVDACRISGKGGVERTVVFTREAQIAIESYVAARWLIEKKLESDHALFVSHARNMYHALTPQSIWRELNEAANDVFEAGQRPAHVGPHAFRHLRAQLLSNEGMSIDVLQKYLGHASIEVTRSTYAPETPDAVLVDQVTTYGKSAIELIKDVSQPKTGAPNKTGTKRQPS